MRAKQLGNGFTGFDLAEVIAHLAKSVPLVLHGLQEVLFLGLNVLGQRLVSKHIRPVIALPPFKLVLGNRLLPLHVTFDFVDLTYRLMCNLPESCKLGFVGGPSLGRGLEALDEGLAVNHQLNLLPWRGEGLNHEEGHVLGTHRRARMVFGQRHTGRTRDTLSVNLVHCTGCDRHVRVIDVLARAVAV
jgi:hypothetical protein